MKEKYVFQLSEVLEISKKGEFVETGSIEFDPPSMKTHDEVSDFEQLFMGSMISAGNLFKADVATEQEDVSALEQLKQNTPSAKEVRMMITVSQDIKLKHLFSSFKKIAFKSARIDDMLIKTSHFEKISRDDNIRMLCEYASFFIFPSLLGGESDETIGSETSVT